MIFFLFKCNQNFEKMKTIIIVNSENKILTSGFRSTSQISRTAMQSFSVFTRLIRPRRQSSGIIVIRATRQILNLSLLLLAISSGRSRIACRFIIAVVVRERFHVEFRQCFRIARVVDVRRCRSAAWFYVWYYFHVVLAVRRFSEGE